VPPRPLYVLTVAPAEALCGEEERFGKLCEDACATDTDRSVAVEGVRLRVRELVLTLPTSRVVPFTARHLRSRVASAYYREERRAVPSMISGAGLRTPVWCAGADGIGGDEIPLAVFDRSGALTTFVDMWTARRELVETTPQRYWQWRFAARPLDVFLAQILQFQCQLVGIGSDGGPDDTDPCADKRRALQEVDAVLETLSAMSAPRAAALANRPAAAIRELPDVLVARLGELQTLVAGALAGSPVSPSGSLLIDHGIVETAAAGYLPIDPRKDVRAQVRAFMGAGVDLRFCAVRPDFVPEALQEAQHMERISLTQGLDDPGRLEEVDVLVPDGTFEPAPTAMGVFEGRVRVVPGVVRDGADSETGAALALNAVGRDQVSDGWSWTIAAYGEAPQRLGVTDLAAAVLRDAGGPAPADMGDQVVRIHVEDDAAHAAMLTDPGMLLRLNREGANARLRLDRVVAAAVDRLGGFDILHNNVGIGAGDAPPHRLSDDDYDRILDVNLRAMWRTCRAAVPVLRAQERSAIVNVSSLASIAAATNLTAYKISKAGVNALTQNLALTGARHGMRANAVLPGLIDTPMGVDQAAELMGVDRDEYAELRAGMVPLGHQGSAWDVARAALFLASDDAAFITGVCLPVDGGQSARIG